MTKPPQTGPQRRRITLERTYAAPLDDVWDLWTTKDGIESWWGPDGFAVTVHRLDVRAGGELAYAQTAVAPEQVAFMKQAKMPLTTEVLVSYTEVVPHARLGYWTLADFVPGMEAYTVQTLVELHPGPGDVRMVLTFDAMHDDRWTQLMSMGWESQLGRLGKLLAARRTVRS
jgi:uncharacterized protein YndB with AHSA1/START domain